MGEDRERSVTYVTEDDGHIQQKAYPGGVINEAAIEARERR